MMKKILFLGLLLVGLFLVVSCAPGEGAIAGQATDLGNVDRTVRSCTDNTADGSITVMTGGQVNRAGILTGARTATLNDGCQRSTFSDYSCASSTVQRQHRVSCSSSERCVNDPVNPCVARCTDNDPANDLAVRGVVTITQTGVTTSDSCLAPSTRFPTGRVRQVDCGGGRLRTLSPQTCPSGTTCGDGACVPLCGNNVVDTGETCVTCPGDAACASGQSCNTASSACVALPSVENTPSGSIISTYQSEDSLVVRVTSESTGNPIAEVVVPSGESAAGVTVIQGAGTSENSRVVVTGTPSGGRSCAFLDASSNSGAYTCPSATTLTEGGFDCPGRITYTDAECDAGTGDCTTNDNELYRVCSSGSSHDLTPELETCNDADDNSDGLIDEGCDDDNDGFCDASMTFTPLSGRSTCASGRTIWNSNCCTAGGGDCDDTSSSIRAMVGDYGAYWSEICNNGIDDNCDGNIDGAGMLENCYFTGDENCDGRSNENCLPLSCVDNDPTNDQAVGGSLSITYGNGQEVLSEMESYYGVGTQGWYVAMTVDSCCTDVRTCSLGSINQTVCNSLSGSTLYSMYGQTIMPCPSGTTCTDSDGPTGTTPAVCS